MGLIRLRTGATSIFASKLFVGPTLLLTHISVNTSAVNAVQRPKMPLGLSDTKTHVSMGSDSALLMTSGVSVLRNILVGDVQWREFHAAMLATWDLGCSSGDVSP